MIRFIFSPLLTIQCWSSLCWCSCTKNCKSAEMKGKERGVSHSTMGFLVPVQVILEENMWRMQGIRSGVCNCDQIYPSSRLPMLLYPPTQFHLCFTPMSPFPSLCSNRWWQSQLCEWKESGPSAQCSACYQKARYSPFQQPVFNHSIRPLLVINK